VQTQCADPVCKPSVQTQGANPRRKTHYPIQSGIEEYTRLIYTARNEARGDGLVLKNCTLAIGLAATNTAARHPIILAQGYLRDLCNCQTPM